MSYSINDFHNLSLDHVLGLPLRFCFSLTIIALVLFLMVNSGSYHPHCYEGVSSLTAFYLASI